MARAQAEANHESRVEVPLCVGAWRVRGCCSRCHLLAVPRRSMGRCLVASHINLIARVHLLCISDKCESDESDFILRLATWIILNLKLALRSSYVTYTMYAVLPDEA